MDSEKKVVGSGEAECSVKAIVIVHHQIAGRGSHENFESDDFALAPVDLIEMGLVCAEIKAEMQGDAGPFQLLLDQLFFLFDPFQCDCRRESIGHIENRRDAAIDGRFCGSLPIFLVLKSRRAEMHMGIDQRRKQGESLAIDDDVLIGLEGEVDDCIIRRFYAFDRDHGR